MCNSAVRRPESKKSGARTLEEQREGATRVSERCRKSDEEDAVLRKDEDGGGGAPVS